MKITPSTSGSVAESFAALRASVTEMDGSACAALNDIKAVSALVLMSLESSTPTAHTDAITRSLSIIKTRAEEAIGNMNHSAEAVVWNLRIQQAFPRIGGAS